MESNEFHEQVMLNIQQYDSDVELISTVTNNTSAQTKIPGVTRREQLSAANYHLTDEIFGPYSITFHPHCEEITHPMNNHPHYDKSSVVQAAIH